MEIKMSLNNHYQRLKANGDKKQGEKKTRTNELAHWNTKRCAIVHWYNFIFFSPFSRPFSSTQNF